MLMLLIQFVFAVLPLFGFQFCNSDSFVVEYFGLLSQFVMTIF